MKPVKILLITVFVLAVIGAGVWQVWLKPQVAFAQVATAFGAKQVCSCRFVAEREMESCLVDFTADLSAVSFNVSSSLIADNRSPDSVDTVTASVLGGLIQSRARYEDGLGCALVKE